MADILIKVDTNFRLVKGSVIYYNGKSYELINIKDLLRDELDKVERLETKIGELMGINGDLQTRLAQVEYELAYNRGEISEERYLELCGKK